MLNQTSEVLNQIELKFLSLVDSVIMSSKCHGTQLENVISGTFFEV